MTAPCTVRTRPWTGGRGCGRSASEPYASPGPRSPIMCTMIAHQVKIEGRGRSGPEWFEGREANVSYHHPYDLPLEHALNIHFVNQAVRPGSRGAVRPSLDPAAQPGRTLPPA